MTLAIVLATSLACGSSEEWDAPLRPVRVHRVVEEVTSDGLRYSADIRPAELVTVSFKSGGYVEEITQRRGIGGRLRKLQEGDLVRQGDVLARLRQPDFAEASNQAEARVAEARANHDRLSDDLARAERLVASNSMARAEYESIQAAHSSSLARLQGAEAALAGAQLVTGDTTLRSPLRGVVLERGVEQGALVGPGSVAFVLGSVDRVRAIFGAPGEVVDEFDVGQRLRVTVDSIAGEDFMGVITAISPAADPFTRVFDVEVTLDNAEGRLKPGMIATVLVDSGDPEAAAGEALALVPLNAIVRPPGRTEGYALYVIEAGEGATLARIREVELGDVFGNRVAIRSGLEPGEVIVVTGATLVVDGEAVAVIPGSGN